MCLDSCNGAEIKSDLNQGFSAESGMLQLYSFSAIAETSVGHDMIREVMKWSGIECLKMTKFMDIESC